MITYDVCPPSCGGANSTHATSTSKAVSADESDVTNRRLSDAMLSYWASFARSGTPIADGQPAWEAYGKAANYMAFAQGARPGTGLFPGMFALHEAAVCRRRAAGQPWNWNTGVISPVLAKAAGCR